MDLAELHTLLQGAKDGSEYLDYAIQRVLFPVAKPVPEYTRSLDAAMRLMPLGWSIHRLGQVTDCRGGFAGWIGDIFRASCAMIPYPANGTAPSAPLALCLAIVRTLNGEMKAAEDRAAQAAEAELLQRSGT